VAARPPQAPARVENRAPLPAQNDGNGQPNGSFHILLSVLSVCYA